MTNKKAFTLVELSIVLVVMGLLVAATMSGAALLNTAKLKSVISEIESYKIAVDNFQTQYENLPGDMPNATSFWTTAQNGGVAVGDGNGDGLVGTGGSDYTEPYYAWNHLTLSKFVPGTFSGSSAIGSTVGVNIPASKYIDSIGFGLNYYPGPWNYVDALNRKFLANYIFVGKGRTGVSFPGIAGFLAEDAYYIDNKIDDGTPDFGKMLAGDVGTCTSGSAPNIIYDLSKTTLVCFLAVNLN